MKKKLLICFVVILLALQPSVPAVAKPAILPISAYCLDDQLHAFVKMKNKYDGTQMKVSQLSGNATIGTETAPMRFKESGATARYLFMIDLSGSMREKISSINKFITALVYAEKQNAVFSVASFGERFSVVTENQTDKDAIINTVTGLNYKEQRTNPYNAIINALDYLDNCPRQSGDIVNLILISDGESDLGSPDKKQEEKKKKQLAATAKKEIKSSSGVVLHTAIFSDKDSKDFSVFKVGTGINQTLTGMNETEKAGEKISAYTDSLYYVTLAISGASSEETVPVELQFKGNNAGGKRLLFNVFWDTVPLLKNFSSAAEPKKENTKKEDKGKESAGKGEDGKKENRQTGKENNGTNNGKDTADVLEDHSTADVENFAIKPPVFVMIILLAVLCVIVLLIARKRKMKTAQDDGELPPTNENAILMKLEILSGKSEAQARKFYLADEMIIGSDSGCDLVLKEKGVSARNSRIFRRDQMIYIEDLGSKNGTVLAGMRLQAASRLRSGDEIEIGESRFLFRF